MEKYRILSDVFAVPGLFCLFFGALRYLANQATFHGLNYILKNALRLLTLQQAKVYAPKERKQNGSAVLLLIGALLLTAAGIFAGLYHP